MPAEPFTEDLVREALSTVVDPEAGMNVVDLGLVYGIEIADERIHVRMTMTTAACPMADMILDSAHQAIQAIAPDATILLELVWEPPWTPAMMSESARGFFGWNW
jgi:metal-sulfur cluster biosynthetic enzyme